MKDMSGIWYVACNVHGDSVFRDGAKCHVVLFNRGNGSDRMMLGGLSRGGRYIEKYVPHTKIFNLRPAYSPGIKNKNMMFFTTKEDAQIYTDTVIKNHSLLAKEKEKNIEISRL